ncbi:hypothetical protein MSPP1_002202 [Malassezia sp. CBS 17886]|nr:hypothetical protein MSPP1_002202 [Malassezia sp. CBS 17886]
MASGHASDPGIRMRTAVPPPDGPPTPLGGDGGGRERASADLVYGAVVKGLPTDLTATGLDAGTESVWGMGQHEMHLLFNQMRAMSGNAAGSGRKALVSTQERTPMPLTNPWDVGTAVGLPGSTMSSPSSHLTSGTRSSSEAPLLDRTQVLLTGAAQQLQDDRSEEESDIPYGASDVSAMRMRAADDLPMRKRMRANLGASEPTGVRAEQPAEQLPLPPMTPRMLTDGRMQPDAVRQWLLERRTLLLTARERMAHNATRLEQERVKWQQLSAMIDERMRTVRAQPIPNVADLLNENILWL